MSNQKKLSGKERRNFIIKTLIDSDKPITGTYLAELTNVSRQVIVTDMALLKTANEPIIATNRGYLYLQERADETLIRRIVACNHTPSETRDELESIVDCGVTVEDVIVEHPLYGELKGSLQISSRFDVEQFLQSIEKHEASLLSILTDGPHLHTLVADSSEKIDLACQLLAEKGILYTEDN